MNNYKINIAWDGKEKIENFTVFGYANTEEEMKEKIQSILNDPQNYIIKISLVTK